MRRLFLHLANEGAAARPTVDAIRKRLGGRASTEPGAGEVVSLGGAGERPGVVLFVRGDQLDVWLSADRVQRVRRADARPLDGVVPRDLAAVAADARAFAVLGEGQRVAFHHDGSAVTMGAPGEGVLIEKCRFGGLVARDDGTVVGVGFRRFAIPPLC